MVQNVIFHDPDDAWMYAHELDIPSSRWPFGVPCPFIWTGASWERWYGREFSPLEIATYTSISDEFQV